MIDDVKPSKYENIELSLPVNAAYVSTVRLTAQSIAGRLGFDAEEIEDIKAAASEACIYIIKNLVTEPSASFKVIFKLEHNNIEVYLSCPAKGKKNNSEGYSMTMLQALMDTLNINLENGLFEMSMTKKHDTDNIV